MKEMILALDFDGTLYRLEEHDTEEMLMASIADTPEEVSLMEKTIRELREGAPPLEFELVLRDMLRGKPLSAIGKATDISVAATSMNEMAHVRKMAEMPNVHLHIISCGTDLMISEFLDRTGILPFTEGIHAKELLTDGNTFLDFVWHIRGAEDKKTVLEQIRAEHPGAYIIAVGDGITDGPMLSVADEAYVMEWPGARHVDLPYPHISSYEGLLARVRELSR